MSRWPSKLLAIDFDHTINNNQDIEEGARFSKPFKGAKESIESFRSKGYKIMIHSCNRKQWILEWMNHWEIPFDYIWDGDKPVADCYIDDCAVGFRGDWESTTREVEDLLNERYNANN